MTKTDEPPRRQEKITRIVQERAHSRRGIAVKRRRVRKNGRQAKTAAVAILPNDNDASDGWSAIPRETFHARWIVCWLDSL